MTDTTTAPGGLEARCEKRLRELSIVIANHLGGGSEWFSAIGDQKFVSADAIKGELQRRKTEARVTKLALIRANRKLQEHPNDAI